MAEIDSTDKQEQKNIIGVRFSKISKNYNFDAGSIDDLAFGDFVVVKTSRGWQLGEVADFVSDLEGLDLSKIKKIDRKATEKDLEKRKEIQQNEQEANMRIAKWIRELDIEGMKFIYTEISFDGNCITFHYTSEENKIKNFRKLQDALKRDYPKNKINFHKIGPRDAAKYFGGMGACGLETRCCSKFLHDFDSISIRMAKTQGISLTPTDITGMCERLRCCLNYEYCTYRDAMKGMPKRNKRVMTPKGEGKVRDVYPLRKSVLVMIPEVGIKEFPVDEVKQIIVQQNQQNRNNNGNQKNNNRNSKNRRNN